MEAKSCRGTATSASWNVAYLACRVTLAPILTKQLVGVQLDLGDQTTFPIP
jgi:hypothetical protein